MRRVPVAGRVQRKHKTGAETEEVEPITVSEVGDRHAIVQYSLGLTRNLGNYESARAYVSLAVPCEPDPTSIGRAFDWAKDWVDKRVEGISAELDGLVTDAGA